MELIHTFQKILGTANFVANAVDFFFTSSRTIFKNSLLFIIWSKMSMNAILNSYSVLLSSSSNNIIHF